MFFNGRFFDAINKCEGRSPSDDAVLQATRIRIDGIRDRQETTGNAIKSDRKKGFIEYDPYPWIW
jgi:hypothetical protein